MQFLALVNSKLNKTLKLSKMSERKEITGEIEKFDQVEVLEEEYIVEKILDKKKVGSVWKYRVKWEGFPEEECTWEPKENLRNVKYLLDEFQTKQENKDKPKTEKSSLLKTKTKRNNANLENDAKEDEISNSVTSSDMKGKKEISNSQKILIGNSSSSFFQFKSKFLNL
jgi:hypothetical protein